MLDNILFAVCFAMHAVVHGLRMFVRYIYLMFCYIYLCLHCMLHFALRALWACIPPRRCRCMVVLYSSIPERRQAYSSLVLGSPRAQRNTTTMKCACFLSREALRTSPNLCARSRQRQKPNDSKEAHRLAVCSSLWPGTVENLCVAVRSNTKEADDTASGLVSFSLEIPRN